MNEDEGSTITDLLVDEKESFCIFYDDEILTQEEAIKKYQCGDFVKYL